MKKLIVICLVVLCVVSFWRFSKLESFQKNVDVARQAGWDALVGVEYEDDSFIYWPGIEVTPSKKQLKRMAIANITSGTYSGSCDIVWRIPSGSDQGEIAGMTVAGGGIAVTIGAGTPIPGGLRFVISFPYAPVTSANLDVMYAEPYAEARLHFEWRQDSSVLEEVASALPIGEKTDTHAKERIITETWSPSGNVIGTVTGDGVNITKTRPAGNMEFTFGGSFDPDFWGICGKYAVSFENITFCGEIVDLSGALEQKWHDTPPDYFNGTPNPLSGLWIEGTEDGTLGLWGPNYQAGPFIYTDWSGGAISSPLNYNFENCVFKWMDDTLISDTLEVYCTGLRTLNESGIDIGPWHGTISALREKTWKQKYGFHTWDSWAADMSSTVELYLDLTSAEALGIEIRGPQPKIKIEGCGFSGGTKWVEGYISPYDGQYSRYMMYNGEWMLTNGSAYLYLLEVDGEEWGLGPGPPSSPYYISVGGGPTGVFVVNTDSYNDSIIFEDIGQRQFSGLFGEGVGPAVSDSTAEAISLDSHLAIPSYQHNGTFIFDTWPLDAVSRTVAPHFTDVVNIAIDTSKNVYANAHTHEDWEGSAGVVGPDVDGYFTMPAGGGSLTLTLKCNYRKRQSLVGGENETAVPTAYWTRRANVLT